MMRPRSSHGLVRVAFTLLPYALIALLALYVWQRRDEIETTFDAPVMLIVAVAVLAAIGQSLNSLEFWLQYRAAGFSLSVGEQWALFSAGQLGNHLPAQMGTIYRFRYLRRVHGAEYATSVSTMAMNLVITLASTGICGLIGVMATAIVDGEAPSWSMTIVFVLLGSVAVLTAVVPLPSALGRPGTRRARIWSTFHASWEATARDPQVAAMVLGLEVVKLAILAVRFYLVFDFVGVDAPITVYLVLGPIAALMGVLAITPGAIGMREAAVAAAAAGMGYSVPDGLTGATVDRGVLLITTLILGMIGYLVTIPRLRRAEGIVTS